LTRCRGAIPAAPVVAWILASRHLVNPAGLQFVAGAIAVVGLASPEKLVRHLCISIKPLTLVVRPFIMIQPHPGQTLEDDIHCLLRGSLPVGILNAENKLAAVMPGIEP
jgi:hypothetical protein